MCARNPLQRELICLPALSSLGCEYSVDSLDDRGAGASRVKHTLRNSISWASNDLCPTDSDMELGRPGESGNSLAHPRRLACHDDITLTRCEEFNVVGTA